jgi:hypothetical protein
MSLPFLFRFSVCAQLKELRVSMEKTEQLLRVADEKEIMMAEEL